MTRVSLKEAYDNKDVVAQIFAIKDTANGAEETANNASTTANEAKTHVDTVAVDVERAVNTANRASESAQESARVVAGYDARLTTAEDGVARNRSDIQTIDGEITDIYNDLTNVVRKVGDAGQVIQNGLTLRGNNRAPNTVVGELNDLIVNAKRLIEEINAYEFMVRTVDNQTVGGQKSFLKIPALVVHEALSNNQDGWRKLLISPSFASAGEYAVAVFDIADNHGSFGTFKLVGRNNAIVGFQTVTPGYSAEYLRASRDSNNEIIIWCSRYRSVTALRMEIHSGTNQVTFKDSETVARFDEPTTDTYEQVVTPSA